MHWRVYNTYSKSELSHSSLLADGHLPRNKQLTFSWFVMNAYLVHTFRRSLCSVQPCNPCSLGTALFCTVLVYGNMLHKPRRKSRHIYISNSVQCLLKKQEMILFRIARLDDRYIGYSPLYARCWPPCSTERTAFEKVVCLSVCAHFLPFMVCKWETSKDEF